VRRVSSGARRERTSSCRTTSSPAQACAEHVSAMRWRTRESFLHDAGLSPHLKRTNHMTNREIKFRVWDEKKRKLRTVTQLFMPINEGVSQDPAQGQDVRLPLPQHARPTVLSLKARRTQKEVRERNPIGSQPLSSVPTLRSFFLPLWTTPLRSFTHSSCLILSSNQSKPLIPA
jgi:hypothetical protein